MFKPEMLSLFPTLNSLQEVITLATASLPVSQKNHMISLLACYHNTLLNQLKK